MLQTPHSVSMQALRVSVLLVGPINQVNNPHMYPD